MPTIPIEQQSPHRGGQRAAAAKPLPDNQADISANPIRCPPRLWDRAVTCAFLAASTSRPFIEA